MPDDDPARPLTVTGGMTFAGGAGNNYGTHALATLVGTLRDHPGTAGLTSGLGWYLSAQGIGVYGIEPLSGPDHFALLVTEEGCGRLGTLRADGEVDLR